MRDKRQHRRWLNQYYIKKYPLFFTNVGYDLTLVLLDEGGDIVCTTEVPAGTAEVDLPATLSGTYVLELYPSGSYYFYSEIIL